MCLMSYTNNKDADQPAPLRSLISTIVVRCLDSMICILVLLLWFLAVTCSCCPYLYFGSAVMLVTYFSKF